MVAKLEGLMNAAETERDRAFNEDVLTISIGDISEGLVSSTAGHGGEQGDGGAAAGRAVARDAQGVERRRADYGGGEPEAEAPAAPADRGEPAAGSHDAPTESRDVEQFREWLRRLRSK
jgi:hypothetical protein